MPIGTLERIYEQENADLRARVAELEGLRDRVLELMLEANVVRTPPGEAARILGQARNAMLDDRDAQRPAASVSEAERPWPPTECTTCGAHLYPSGGYSTDSKKDGGFCSQECLDKYRQRPSEARLSPEFEAEVWRIMRANIDRIRGQQQCNHPLRNIDGTCTTCKAQVGALPRTDEARTYDDNKHSADCECEACDAHEQGYARGFQRSGHRCPETAVVTAAQWDEARKDLLESLALDVERVPVADRNPALVRNEIVDLIRAQSTRGSADRG
jgi:hypothetical protein